MKIKIGLIILFSVIGLAVGARQALAAAISAEQAATAVGVGEEVSIPVYFDSQGEEINTIAATIVYPKALLELEDASGANSVINFWVQQPTAQQPAFSGLVAGGFNGSKGLLLTLKFKALALGQASLEFTDLKFLLNDGLGTEAPASSQKLNISVQAATTSPVTVATTTIDTVPPQPFSPQVGRSPTIFNNQWFLAFQAQDQGSGMAYYEVAEVLYRQPKAGDWSRQASPYILKDQSRGSYLFVKAVDRAGNERVEEVLPEPSQLWYEKFVKWVIIFLAIFLIGVIAYAVIRWRKRPTNLIPK